MPGKSDSDDVSNAEYCAADIAVVSIVTTQILMDVSTKTLVEEVKTHNDDYQIRFGTCNVSSTLKTLDKEDFHNDAPKILVMYILISCGEKLSCGKV